MATRLPEFLIDAERMRVERRQRRVVPTAKTFAVRASGGMLSTGFDCQGIPRTFNPGRAIRDRVM
jgi:hypothetical protein